MREACTRFRDVGWAGTQALGEAGGQEWKAGQGARGWERRWICSGHVVWRHLRGGPSLPASPYPPGSALTIGARGVCLALFLQN